MIEAAKIFMWGNLWIILIALIFGRWLTSQARTPNVWTYFIALSLLPLLAAFIIPLLNTVPFEWAINAKSVQTQIERMAEEVAPFSKGLSLWMFLAYIYGAIAALKVIGVVVRWTRLQLMPLSITETQGVYITDRDVPALALSWPKRCVVLPATAKALSREARGQIIAHERAHLKYNDAEITLIYLILQNLFWTNPAMRWFVTGWRDAAEIRADHAVTAGTDMPARKAYAQVLLSAMAQENGERARQCPSAYLTSNSLRSVKMRLSEIMTTEPRGGNRFYKGLAISCGLIISMGGASFMTATAAPAQSQPLKRVPPMMPASCPNLDMKTVEVKSYTSKMNGQKKSYRAANIGTVILKFDIDKAGRTKNIKAVKSNNICFEGPALKSVVQWVYSSGAPQKGVENMIKFRLSEDPDSSTSIEDDIKAFSNP